MSEMEAETDPADEPNESAWNEEMVEGQLDELEDPEDLTTEDDEEDYDGGSPAD